MSYFKMKKLKMRFFSTLVSLFIVIGFNANLWAQTAELNPGYVSGTIRIGSELINVVDIFAYDPASIDRAIKWTLAETQVTPPANSTSVNYSLVVNIPAEGTQQFGVTACGVYMDNSNDRVCFPIEVVTVNAGQVTTQDFILDNPGFIQGVGTITGDQALQETKLIVTSTLGPIFESITVTDQLQGMAYKVPVAPGTAIQVQCLAYMDSLNWQFFKFFGPEKSVNVAAGQTVTVDCNFEPPTVGSVAGVIDNSGLFETESILSLVDRTNLVNHVIVGNADGTYIFEELPGAEYDFQVYQHYNSHRQTFAFPRLSYNPVSPEEATSVADKPTYIIPAGEVTRIDFSAQQSRINGKISFGGNAPVEHLSDLTIATIGLPSTTTFNGFGIDREVNRSTGEYQLILSEGPWALNLVSFDFFNGSTDPAEYLSQRSGFTDGSFVLENAVETTPSTSGVKDFTIALGEVVVEFGIVGGTGQTLSRPYLQISCNGTDPVTNKFLLNRSFAYNDREQDVEVGTVRFYAIESTCSLIARATVGGTVTRFGEFEIDVKAGTSQVVSLGGPQLTVEFPEPDFVTDQAFITMTGRATDDSQVTAVTVNGVEVAFISTGNPNDPNEVSFSATIPLVNGPNLIETVAFDDSVPAKSGSDTRTVFKEDTPPTVAWTPADGATLLTAGETTTVQLQGTADDDAGIATILVQGVPVPFQTTNNPEKPNEVSFNLSIVLVDGDNFVEVVAKDIGNNQTVDTHKITVTTNRAPIANAGNDLVVEQQNAEGALVVLNGLGSSDPDGDPLTYNWSGPFGLATGGTPSVTLSAGTHQATLVVNDGVLDSLPDSVTITVQDTAPPDYTFDLLVTELWPANHKLTLVGTVSGISDAGAPAPNLMVSVTTNQPLNSKGDGNTEPDWKLTQSGGVWSIYLRAERNAYEGEARIYTITVTTSDANGNTVSESRIVTVPLDQKDGGGGGGGKGGGKKK